VDPPANMDELRSRVAQYINIEENVDARRKMMKTLVVATSKQYPKRKRTEIFENCTCNLGLVQLSPPTTNHPSANSTKKCNYLQNMGHTTEECFKVRDQIEEHIR